MATNVLARPQFGSLDHLRRPLSVVDRIAERNGKFSRLKARAAARIAEKAPDIATTAIRSAAISGTAFAFGFGHGRVPEKMSLGAIPLEIVTAFGLHTLAAFGPVSTETARHLQAVGDGALAAFACALGRGMGRRARKSAGLPPPAETLLSGDEGEPMAGETGGGALSDEELARLARRR